MAKWTAFPHDAADYSYDTAALKKKWARLHAGDAEPLPTDAKVLAAWALFHAGQFQKATEAGLKAGDAGLVFEASPLAFELARDGRDLTALFGGPGACRDRLIAAMDLANVIDLAAFLPAYALFLAAWFRCRRGGAPAAARWGVAIVIGAALADVLENVCLLALTPGLDPASPWLARLPWVTGVKWLGLGAAAAVAATIFARGGRWSRVGAALCALAPAATIAATLAPARFGPVVSLGVAAGWLACLVDAARRARVTAPAA